MPAVARSPVYRPRCRPSFGASEIPYFANHNVGPNHLHHLLGSLSSHPCDQFCFLCSSSGFRVAPRVPKLDQCTFRALFHAAGLKARIWACKLGRKPQQKAARRSTGSTHARTTMLKGSEMVLTGPLFTLISIVKPKPGVGSQVEKGWDRPTKPDLGPT